MDKDWKVFQTDVLDLLKQYEGFMDFFERVGSLSGNSRPDAFARITREEKKEIWVLDAKNKAEIDSEDEERMQKYIDQVARNPVDIGLEVSELSEHEIRGIFITSEPSNSEYENMHFQRLHQFLQKELIYTDTDKIVRDVAKMVERRELSQSQARLLNKSLEPFRKRLEKVQTDLKQLEEEFIGLKLHTPPFKDLEFSPASDAVLEHCKREGVFMIDIPYSPDEAEKSEEKAIEMENRIEEKAYYVSIHNFDVESEFTCRPEMFKKKLTEELGILSPSALADIFEPKFAVDRKFEDGFILLGSEELGFNLKISSSDDVKHKVEASLNSEAVSRIRERCTNSRRDFGKVKGKNWVQELEISENLEVDYGRKESLESYRQTVNSIFHSAVNPVYSKKIARKVE